MIYLYMLIEHKIVSFLDNGLTRNNILQKDTNMLVPVRSSLLMVEAQGMKQLVLDD